jgi:peroxiredoxin (alkyl hydroperoxide reductase subunit C)
MSTVGKQAPEFSVPAYNPAKKDIETVSLAGQKGKWVVLCFYPADFTFVCPTELKDLNDKHAEFAKRDAVVLGASTDTVWSHKAWMEQEKIIEHLQYPLLADKTGAVARAYGVYNEEKGIAQRGLFIIDPDGVLKAAYVTDDPVGRSASEALRLLDGFIYVRKNPGFVCPASWEPGKGVLKPGIAAAGRVHEQMK